MSCLDEKRGGIHWFDDTLSSVANHAAMDLDSIRSGYTSEGDHLRVLVVWLMDVSRGESHCGRSAEVFLYRLTKEIGRELSTTYPDSVRAFAAEIGTALTQSLYFDPSLNGWSRTKLIHLCVEISKLASVDDFYGGRRQVHGQWRNVNWWRAAGPHTDATTTEGRP